MPRKLLLLSNSTQHGGSYLEYCSHLVKAFFLKYDVKKVLFIPYALRDHDAYAKKARDGLAKLDLKVQSIHESHDPVEAVQKAEAIFIGGGNTFKLLKSLYELELLEAIRSRVLKDGIPYMGASAGTNMATVTICTTNDMPIEYPPSFTALGLVPFNINPHYIDTDPSSTHMGETRDDRIKEYHDIPGMPPVLAMREGCILVVDDNKAVLTGIKGAKLFVMLVVLSLFTIDIPIVNIEFVCLRGFRNKEPVEYGVGSDVSFLIQAE